MDHQADVFLGKFQSLFIGLFAVIFALVIAAVVTAVGSNSVLDARTNTSVTALETTASDSSNAVTASMYDFVEGARRAMFSTGRALYGACRSITIATTQSSRAIANFGVAVVHGIGFGLLSVVRVAIGTVLFALRLVGNSVLFITRSIGSGILFVARTPLKAAALVSNTDVVTAAIRPASSADPAPTINEAVAAASLTRVQQVTDQEAAQLRAAQLAANRGLGGEAIAGDPQHGGYPAKWDAPVRQDRTIDNWGMFNRECVSYTAWKVYQTFGHMPYWGGIGNANQWPSDARAAGIATGSTPKVHSVAVSLHGYYGHTMWVEAVNGNMIYVSQYNYDLQGHYSEMWVDGSNFTYIYFK